MACRRRFFAVQEGCRILVRQARLFLPAQATLTYIDSCDAAES